MGTASAQITRIPGRIRATSRNAYVIQATTGNTAGCTHWGAGTASCACLASSATTTRTRRVPTTRRRMAWLNRIWTVFATPDTRTRHGETRLGFARTARRIRSASGVGTWNRVWPTRYRLRSPWIIPGVTVILAGGGGTTARVWLARARPTATEGWRRNAARGLTAHRSRGIGSTARAFKDAGGRQVRVFTFFGAVGKAGIMPSCARGCDRPQARPRQPHDVRLQCWCLPAQPP